MCLCCVSASCVCLCLYLHRYVCHHRRDVSAPSKLVTGVGATLVRSADVVDAAEPALSEQIHTATVTAQTQKGGRTQTQKYKHADTKHTHTHTHTHTHGVAVRTQGEVGGALSDALPELPLLPTNAYNMRHD